MSDIIHTFMRSLSDIEHLFLLEGIKAKMDQAVSIHGLPARIFKHHEDYLLMYPGMSGTKIVSLMWDDEHGNYVMLPFTEITQ